MSNLFFAILVAAVAVAMIQQFFDHSRSSQRRIYWSCACVGAIAAFFAFYPDWEKGFGMALFFLGAMAAAAYGYTPYIKIRGKIFALNSVDSQPDPEDKPAENGVDSEDHVVSDAAPDSYSGLLTARKLWWVVAILMLIAAVNVRIFIESGGADWVPGVIGAAFLLFFSIVLGLGDASWGYGIARGQYLQFVIVSIITASTFTIIYLIAYWIAKRKPVRSKHSMEYRAHPRHQDTAD
ncbi:hypothetical protein M1247_34225 [Mycobacterium sp. 21AC1]|uniref:hypothetical protein n=1 Tax=[Mycobacterium] appelbergii TaxID=2939269 RepID=UPI0029391441|nr:hypothetical protein [Mycobacterium sp. 21AC1]MDV3130004.1 hypothetical protein [Mycobacterium sp. 21AC1]